MPKMLNAWKQKGGPQCRPSGVNLMTNTCLLCTVHSCISHLGCPGARGPDGLIWCEGTCPDVWGSIWAEEAFTMPLSVHLERRGQVLFNHSDWLPVVMCFPGAKTPTPSPLTHGSSPQFSHEISNPVSPPQSFSMHEMVAICLSKGVSAFKSTQEALASRFWLPRH